MMTHQQTLRDPSAKAQTPIKYVTENDFRIIRLCDVDPSVKADGAEHCFIVRNPDGYELDVDVEIAAEAVAEVICRSRQRISLASSFWIACAERHLAEYLWEEKDYPPHARLVVEQLTLEDLDLARRWESSEE